MNDKDANLLTQPAAGTVQSGDSLRLRVEQVPQAVVVLDPAADRLVAADSSAEQLFGSARNEMLKHHLREFCPAGQPDGRPVAESLQKHKTRAVAGETSALKRATRNAQGRELVCPARLNKLPGTGRNLPRAYCTDIGGRKQAGQTLRKSDERKYQTLFEESFDGLFVTSPEGKLLDMNKKVVEMFGYDTKKEMLQLDLERDVYAQPPDRARILALVNAQGSAEYDVVVKKKSGENMTTHCALTAVKDETAAITCYRGIIRDITEQKRAQEELQKSEARLQLQFERMPIACIMWTPEFQVTSWNPAAERIFGFTASEIIGKHANELLVPRDAQPQVDAVWSRLLEGDNAAHSIHENMTKDGRIIICDWTNTPLIEADGRVVGVLSMVQDVTERQRAQEALRKSEANLRDAQEIAAIGSWEWDLASDTHFWSEEECRIFGRDPTLPAPTSQQFMALVHPDDRKKVEEATACAQKTGAPFRYEYRINRLDGSERIVEARGKCFLGTDGKPARLAGTIHDITERKQAEKVLLQTNRALLTMSQGDEVLVHATSEEELLAKMCRVLVEVGGYVMAWIGFAEHDAAKTVRPVAWAGHEDGFLSATRITWADTEHGRGPTGTAIRTGEPQVNQDIATNPRLAQWRKEALKRGYQLTVALPLKSESSVIGALTLYSTRAAGFDNNELRLLVELAADLSYGIGALRTRAARERSEQALRNSMEATIVALASMVELRDPYTAGHQHHVSLLAAAIAREMGLSEHDIEGIRLAAVVHDIGKINVPAEILSKPGKLTKAEFELIKAHPQTGHDIIKGVEFPWPVAQMILQHQERLDGSGYPQGLKGDAILIGARIIAVADVVEAMTEHRPYRAALGLDAAITEIEAGKGKLYDPAAVDACRALFREHRFSFS